MEVLWGPDAEVVSGSRPPTGAGSSYVIALGRSRPRLLLPADRTVARAALRGGSGTRSSAAGRRRKAVAQALGTEAAWGLLRDHVWVPGVDPLREILSDALGTSVSVAVALRVRVPFRKPMLQVLSLTGEVVAYAKVAWNEVTADNVRAEHEALRAFATATSRIRTPDVVALLEHRGFPILVTRPMPDGVRRLRSDDGPPPVDVARETSEVLASIRAPSAMSERLRERLDAVHRAGPRSSWVGPVVAAAMDTQATIDHDGIPAGAWHGDWAPWNVGRDAGTFWIWDWEHWRTDVPVGLDVPHYVFQQRFTAERAPLLEAFEAARSSAEDALTSLGYGAEQRRAVHATHVLEVCLRYLEAETYGVPANARFVAGALDSLRATQP
jgi:hypothetical protein